MLFPTVTTPVWVIEEPAFNVKLPFNVEVPAIELDPVPANTAELKEFVVNEAKVQFPEPEKVAEPPPLVVKAAKA